MAAPFAPYGETVQRYADLGFHPVPIKPGEKRPAISDWNNVDPQRAVNLGAYFEDAGLGVRTDNLAPIDVDVTDIDVATDLLRYVTKRVIKADPALVRYGCPPKFLVLCQPEQAHPKWTSPAYRDHVGQMQRIECMGVGQQVVLSGIHPDTQEPYFWLHGDPLQQVTAVYELPVFTFDQWLELVAYFCELAEKRGWTLVSKGAEATHSDDNAPTFPVAGLTLEIAAEALSFVPNDDAHYDEWLAVGMALHQQGQGDTDWFALWDQWSAKSTKYGGERTNWKHWESFRADRPGGVTMRSVLMDAEERGWTRPQSVEGARLEVEEFPMLDEPNTNPQTRGREFFPELTTPGEWGDYVPPPQAWAWDHWLPIGEASLLYAPGGTGKTRLVQQLATAIATGTPFLGQAVQQGTVIMFLCEDDRDQIIRRQDAIERNGGPRRTEIGESIVMVPRKGKDNLLMVFGKGRGTRTETWKTLARLCLLYKETLTMLFLDTLSDVFGGNEIIRSEAREFVQRACVSIARECQCSVLVAAHPSQSGENTGSGTSGSTAWNGAVRSRLYMYRDPERDGLLVLEQPKTNLGVAQEEKRLRMVDGYLVEVAGEEAYESTREVECRSDLLRILYSMESRNYELTDSPKSDRCYWKVALREQRVLSPGGTQWKRQDYELALSQLEHRGVVELVKTRQDREARSVRVVVMAPGEEGEE